MKPGASRKGLPIDAARVHELLALCWETYARIVGGACVEYACRQRDFHHSAAEWARKHPLHLPRRKTVRVAADCKRIHNALATAGQACWRDGSNFARGFALHSLPKNLHGAERDNELRAVLLEFHWLQAKLEATNPAALMADFDNLPSDGDWGLVQGAIQLSTHAIGPDKNQLASQLVGRLGSETTANIEQLVLSARAWRSVPWLQPLHGNLRPPGTGLLRTLKGHSGEVHAVRVSADGRRVVTGGAHKAVRSSAS